MAWKALVALVALAGLLSQREPQRINAEGAGLFVALPLSGGVYLFLTGQPLNLLPLFLSALLLTVLVVTAGHPKRVLPSECLRFPDEASKLRHEECEKTYGWIVGSLMVAVSAYWIFFKS